jgi:YHS domain-containing protein
MKVKDPVCGMVIEDSTAAAHGVYGGETVFFCSEACHRTYDRTHGARPK